MASLILEEKKNMNILCHRRNQVTLKIRIFQDEFLNLSYKNFEIILSFNMKEKKNENELEKCFK